VQTPGWGFKKEKLADFQAHSKHHCHQPTRYLSTIRAKRTPLVQAVYGMANQHWLNALDGKEHYRWRDNKELALKMACANCRWSTTRPYVDVIRYYGDIVGAATKKSIFLRSNPAFSDIPAVKKQFNSPYWRYRVRRPTDTGPSPLPVTTSRRLKDLAKALEPRYETVKKSLWSPIVPLRVCVVDYDFTLDLMILLLSGRSAYGVGSVFY